MSGQNLKRAGSGDEKSSGSKISKPDESGPSKIVRISTDANSHDKKFPFFRRPRVIGCFSVDGQRQFIADRSQMRFFCPERLKNNPNPGSSYKRFDWNLNDGMANVIRKDNSFRLKEGIQFVLKWILQNKASFRPGGQVLDTSQENNGGPCEFENLSTDFVCFRGLLTTIMCTPYERKDGWQVLVVKHRDTFYLRQLDTEAKLRMEAKQSDRQKQMSSWGYKFEQFALDDLRKGKSDALSGRSDKMPPVNENEEFCCVHRTRLGQHSIVFGAEMDGFQLKVPMSDDNGINSDEIELNTDGHFVELKTSRTIDSTRLEVSFARHKIIKWWCQSFLVGVPVVVCGFRDDNGVVTRITDYPTSKLPAMGANFWLPNVNMNFLDTFLAFVKNSVQSEDCVYKFSWEPPAREISVRKTRDHDVAMVLPQWYTSELFPD